MKLLERVLRQAASLEAVVMGLPALREIERLKQHTQPLFEGIEKMRALRAFGQGRS